MLPFAPRGDALLAYRAVFDAEPYCNLSLFDLTRRHILFHLSLRADDGLAVVNQRRDEVWGTETSCSVPLPVRGVDVAISFEKSGIRVLLDGQEIFRFANRLGRPFRSLKSIGYADFHGGLLGATVDMDVRVRDGLGSGNPRLDGRLELRGAFADDAPLTLDLPDIPQPPELINDAGAVRALLPGRLWQAVPADEALKVGVLAGGQPVGDLTITRNALAQRITQMLENGPDLANDMRGAGQVIEHVRFANLLGRMSNQATGKLLRLASKAGLQGFMLAGAESPPLAPPQIETTARDRRKARAFGQQNVYLSRAVQVLRDSPGLETGAYLATHPPARSGRVNICLVLTELACRRGPDDFETLFDAARALGLRTMPDLPSTWEISALLPWRWLQGQRETLPQMIMQMAQDKENWVMTTPIAWVIRRLAAAPEENEGPGMITAFLAFLHAQDRYWGRTPCIELTAAMAELVASAPNFGSEIANKIDAGAVEIYGLTPRFWAALGGRGSPRMAEASARFAGLETDTEATIRYFEAAGTTDAARYRRELLKAAPDTDEAALRHLAHPLTDEDAARDATLADAARRVMPQLYNETSISPDAALKQIAARAVQGVLNGDAPAQMLTALEPLGDLGHALGLSALAGLIGQGETARAETLWQNLTPPHLMPDTPWAAHTQLQLHRHTGQPLADAALGHFSKAVESSASHVLHKGASPLHDTVVTVFSCKAHLETRIPQMRRGWLRDLEAIGLRYVIVIGGGSDPAGVLDGDVLTLAAEDDYEGLPDKTLATVRWVHDQTPFAHMFKVDDDCLLNVDALFHGLGVMCHDYYGRPLTRIPGQMDRGWHVGKSTSARGRLELDKSPEPSFYADGGSGYALSRRAMAATLRALETPKGRMLVQSSFMEDKLLGDLLSLEGIRVSGEDYLITVRRRQFPGGIPVPRWVNGFDASRIAPVSLVHLDDPDAQDAAYARLQTPTLRPAKIWPSFQQAALGPHSNALELISDPARLDAAQNADVSVVACMRNEMFMLPHFLDHYRGLGAESFLIADNCSDDGTLEFLADQPDVALFSVDTDYGRSNYGVAWQQALVSSFRVGKWSLMADADELLVWEHPQAQSLSALLAGPDFADADAARIFMLDMYPKGPLAAADFASGDPFDEAGFTDIDPFHSEAPGAGPFSNAGTFTSALRHRLIPGSRPELFVAQKFALLRYKPWMRLTAGLHYVGGAIPAKRDLIFSHFKYNADFRRKAQAEVARGQHFNDAEEYRKYLALVSEGRDVIYQDGVSVPWTDSEFARRILGRQP